MALLAVALGGCADEVIGNGKATTEDRQLPDFSELSVSGSFDVVLQRGVSGVRIEADENLMPHISTVVKGDQLEISSDKNLISQGLRITVFYDRLSDIDLSGACELSCTDTLVGKQLNFDVSGTAETRVLAHANELNMDVSGSAEIDLVGVAESLHLDVSGWAELNASQFVVRRASVVVAGSADVVVNASDKLAIDVAGEADVRYIGNPTIERSIAGAADISQVNP